MQTPLRLSRDFGYANSHKPAFNYPSSANGYLVNSGTSLSYTLSDDDDYSLLPSFRFAEDVENEEVYLVGWHLHAPSEHLIDGKSTRAEMHFVHNDADGHIRSVLAFLIAPSGSNGTQSAFFDQIPQPFPLLGSDDEKEFNFDPSLAIEEVGGFTEYWTYRGSLTTPPCTEGLRWFIAAEPLKVDNDMMEQILAVSMFSARPSQALWMHELNV
jgi:carbonic anhydrase